MTTYKAKCILNWDKHNPLNYDMFEHEFSDEESTKSLSSGDITSWISTVLKVENGVNITKRLSEIGADRINITIERVKDTDNPKNKSPKRSTYSSNVQRTHNRY